MPAWKPGRCPTRWRSSCRRASCSASISPCASSSCLPGTSRVHAATRAHHRRRTGRAHRSLRARSRRVTDVTVLESTAVLGGLAQSVNYKGNRIDIGGHRFFSKSDWVMRWWLKMLPLAAGPARQDGEAELRIGYQGASRPLREEATAAESEPRVMLLRSRLSRIYFDGKFFDYPLKANLETALKLGLWRCAGFAASYARALLFPRRPERTLEDFFINRFGRRLYLQFFKAYTEKVWGTPCERISAQWGAQRIKSLSIGKALRHALLKPFRRGGAGLGKSEQT